MLTSATKRTFLVALAVSLLTAGCAGDAAAPDGDDTTAVAASADVKPAALMPAGPLAIPAAEYWTPGEASDQIATVQAGGCGEESACPAFAVISGPDATTIGADDAYLSDGIGCPGGRDMVAHSATAVSQDPAVIAGLDGTLATFDVECTGPSGQDQTVRQRQWMVASADGAVLVVDRWSFAELGDRLAEADWLTAGR